MANTLTDISGIGAAAAAKLTEAGFRTVEDVANATPEALGAVPGFGAARAAKVIDAASALSDTGAETESVEAKTDETPDATSEDVAAVDPVVAAAATGRFASAKAVIAQPRVFISAIAVLVLAGAAFANPGVVSSLYDSATTALNSSDAKQSTVQAASNKPAVSPMKKIELVKASPIVKPVVKVTAKPVTHIPATRRAVQHMPYAPYPARPYYPGNAWNNPWNGNGWGRGAANGGFSMNFSGKSNVAGRGYGYNRPYYGAPYGYPRPVAYRTPVVKPALSEKK